MEFHILLLFSIVIFDTVSSYLRGQCKKKLAKLQHVLKEKIYKFNRVGHRASMKQCTHDEICRMGLPGGTCMMSRLSMFSWRSKQIDVKQNIRSQDIRHLPSITWPTGPASGFALRLVFFLRPKVHCLFRFGFGQCYQA